MAAFTSGTTVQVPQTVAVPQTHVQHHHTDKVVDNRVHERHDPHDDWSSRDMLLSFMPFVIAVAFRDAALHAGLIVALALAVYLLFKRHAFWNSFQKRHWPVLDVTSVILFAILLGTSYKYYEDGTNPIRKWLIVIAGATYAIVALISLLVRRPFTSHYAHFAHFDAGGHGLWQADPAWRATNDKSTFTWFSIFTIICLLSLAPALAYNQAHYGYRALNIIFNYIVPLGLVAIALIVTQMLGRHYSRQTGAVPVVTGVDNRAAMV